MGSNGRLTTRPRMTNSTAPVDSCAGGADGGPDAKWIFGVCVCLLGSLFNTLGFVLQKWAHNWNMELPEDEKWQEFSGLLCHPLWWLGMVFIVVCGIPTDVVAFALLPQSVIAPLSGFTIVCTQVVSPCLLGERVTWSDIGSAWTILLGCTLTT